MLLLFSRLVEEFVEWWEGFGEGLEEDIEANSWLYMHKLILIQQKDWDVSNAKTWDQQKKKGKTTA